MLSKATAPLRAPSFTLTWKVSVDLLLFVDCIRPVDGPYAINGTYGWIMANAKIKDHVIV